MANTIRIKRRPSSGSAGEPSSLFNGELAFNENDNILYYGYGSGVGGAGVATSRPPIGGSGYFAHRGGINASGLWPISVTGNSETVTNGVYTTGTQTVNGLKTFGNLATFNSGINTTAINTSSNNVEYFAVFDSNPASSAQTLKSVSKSDVLDDIGGASSGISITAGSGLVGGGNLSASRIFDIGQGDGISVGADSIAVDSTVVRTTGTQTIDGFKTFGNETTFTSGMIVSNQTANNLASFDSNKRLSSSFSIETTLTGGSTSIPRADAVKTYVDNMIVSGIATNDAMIFKGAIDCSTNPNYPAADRGWTYKVSVAGSIGGASGPTVEVNDTIICTTDGTSAGTHASVGSNWVILQTNIADASVLVTGPASATSGNIAVFNTATGKSIRDGNIAFNRIVLTTGNQLIEGVKTFAGGPLKVELYSASYYTDPAFVVQNDLDPGTATTFQINKDGSIVSGIWDAETIAVNRGGTGQTSYTDGQLLIGNSTGNTLSKATLTAGSGVVITNGAGSITVDHADTSTLSGAQGSGGIASITVDGLGHITAVTTATYLTAGTVCAAIADCTLDGGSF